MKDRRQDLNVVTTDSFDTASLSSGYDSPISPLENGDKPNLEHLARQRPAVFRTTLFEASFVTAVVLSLMMSEYFTSGFNIILPSLAQSIDLPEDARTWPTAVPNLAAAALLLPFARLCNIIGARRVFILGHAWLLCWSVVSGFATNHIILIVCRAMQGVGFAAFLPAGMSLLGQVYRPGPRKNLIYSIYGAFACLGFYFGIVVAALTTEYISWKWYFWTGAIFEFATIVFGLLAIPRNLQDQQASARMDWLGLSTIVPCLALLIFAFTEGSQAPQGWATPYVLVTLILGIVFLAAAIYSQGWASSQPLVPNVIFRIRYMKRLLASMTCFFGVCALFLLYTSLYIQDVLKVSPILAAAWYAPMLAGSILLAVMGSMILHLLASEILLFLAGTAFLFSVLLFAIIPATYQSTMPVAYWAYIFPAMCCGTLGIDLAFNVMNIFITTAMPKRDQAAVGALTNTLIYLGSSFWLSISELVVSTARNWKADHFPLVDQYKTSFWLGVGLTGLAMCLAITIRMGTASADLTSDEKETLVEKD